MLKSTWYQKRFPILSDDDIAKWINYLCKSYNGKVSKTESVVVERLVIVLVCLETNDDTDQDRGMGFVFGFSSGASFEKPNPNVSVTLGAAAEHIAQFIADGAIGTKNAYSPKVLRDIADTIRARYTPEE